jgi:predicted metal-dependent hydrolase
MNSQIKPDMPTSLPGPRAIAVGERTFPVAIRRHPRARRYVIRLSVEGEVRLTVPRGASIAGGLAFAERQHAWIQREWLRLEQHAAAWNTGTELWYRGDRVRLSVGPDAIMVGGQVVKRPQADAVVRQTVENYLRGIAELELPKRLAELAAERRLSTPRVTVRNQRSRWGSCSTRGSIALNWRLIQMPPSVADYIILHELAHRRHPNHSTRFWREVESLCPSWKDSERWLRRHGNDLL